MDRINPFTLEEKKNIGYYKFENKVIQKKETETEILKDMGEWSRKYFGYKKDGYLHFNNKKVKIDDDDYEEWED